MNNWNTTPWGFPGGSDSEESNWDAGEPGLISGSGRSPGEENDTPLHYSWLENPMDRGAWWAQSMGSQRVRHDGVTNTFTFFHFLYMDGFQKHSKWKKLDTKNHTLYDPIYIKCLETESRLVATEHGVREEGRLLLNMGSFFRQRKHSKISLWCWLYIFCN